MTGNCFAKARLIALLSLALNLGVSTQCFADTDEALIVFDIPSQPLDLSLIAFSIQADVNVVGVTELLRKYQTPKVTGKMAWTKALTLLTESKDLDYQIIGDKSVSIILVNPPKAQDAYLEEIVVTAEGRSTDLQKTPIAVTVMDQDALYQNQINDLRDLTKSVPGLEMISTMPQAATLVQLRGVGTTNITEIADGPVSIHIDGIYSPRSQAAAALLHDIDRIEVLRGPQGTLFGRNASAGSINIHNRRPLLGELQSDISLGIGNYQQWGFKGALNLPVGDSLGLRFAAAINKHGAYTKLLDNYVGLGSQYPQHVSELTDYD
jgi:iron complex outermembrane receptor protein